MTTAEATTRYPNLVIGAWLRMSIQSFQPSIIFVSLRVSIDEMTASDTEIVECAYQTTLFVIEVGVQHTTKEN